MLKPTLRSGNISELPLWIVTAVNDQLDCLETLLLPERSRAHSYITIEVHATILEITWLQPFNKGYKDSKKPRRNHTETSTGSPLVDRRNMQLLDVL